MRFALCRVLAAGLVAACSVTAFGNDCAGLLVPEFAPPSVDTTTDLAYLSVITADNFALHRKNAIPKMKHVGILLPIASDLLQHSNDFAEFDTKRAHAYAAHGFNYSMADLSAYFERLLPAQYFDAYSACAGIGGFTAQVVKADRDFVELAAHWRAPPNGSAQVPIGKLSISGASLLGTVPTTLQSQTTTLLLARNLDVDVRLSANVNGQPISVWVPRFITAPQRVAAAQPTCADAAKVVRVLLRQTLERDAKPAELTAQTALLKNHSVSVRQLAERAVLSDEYQKKFAQNKSFEETLQSLYRHVLARPADAEGFAGNKKRLKNATFPTIAMSFFENIEYVHNFGEWTVPGTMPAIGYCPTQQ
jgi:hypothetical protein